MNKKAEQLWDVVVIGGGPAGMMAAGRAASLGGNVVLLEKNVGLGKKLLITGGGRCNVTNAEFDTRTLLSKFKENDKFLFSTFSQFSVVQSLEYFHARNMPTKVELEKRVFPTSNSARSVWQVLVDDIKKHHVTILSHSPVAKLVKKNGAIEHALLANGTKIYGKSFVLASGGKSRPETGSTGDGFVWLKELGHTVVEMSGALVPLAIADAWVKKLQGVALAHVAITVLQNGIKQNKRKGKILFTHFGVSGPTVLNISKDVGELLKYGEVVLSLDLLPALDPGALNLELQELFRKESNKKFKNCLEKMIPSSMVPTIVELSKIDGDIPCHSITREMRLHLTAVLKGLEMKVQKLLGLEKAIVSSGGVDLKEVDFKTMRSRLLPNLYLVGDILNIDRPSGGYSLQLCWTTGFVAGTWAAEQVK